MGPTESGTGPDPRADTVKNPLGFGPRPSAPGAAGGGHGGSGRAASSEPPADAGNLLTDDEVAFLGAPPTPAADVWNEGVACSACGWKDPGARRCDLRSGTEAFRVGRRFFVLDIWQGFRFVFLGMLRLMHDPAYVGRLGIPVAANIAAMAAAIFVFFGVLWPTLDAVTTADWGWLGFLQGLAGLDHETLALVLSVVTTMHLAPILLVALTSPFLDDIAAVTEREMCRTQPAEPAPGWWQSLWIGTRAITRIFALQILLLPLGLLLALCGLWVVAVVVAAALNAAVFFDQPFTRRRYGARRRLAILRHNWARALGLGIGFQVALFLPFVNLLLLPGTAVAATMLFYRFGKIDSKKTPAAPAG